MRRMAESTSLILEFLWKWWMSLLLEQVFPGETSTVFYCSPGDEDQHNACDPPSCFSNDVSLNETTALLPPLVSPTKGTTVDLPIKHLLVWVRGVLVRDCTTLSSSISCPPHPSLFCYVFYRCVWLVFRQMVLHPSKGKPWLEFSNWLFRLRHHYNPEEANSRKRFKFFFLVGSLYVWSMVGDVAHRFVFVDDHMDSTKTFGMSWAR